MRFSYKHGFGILLDELVLVVDIVELVTKIIS